MDIRISKREGAWTSGSVFDGNDRYLFEVKRSEEPSAFGLDEGHIIKLWVAFAGGYSPIANFDRGWDRLPRCQEHVDVLQTIIDRFN